MQEEARVRRAEATLLRHRDVDEGTRRGDPAHAEDVHLRADHADGVVDHVARFDVAAG